MNELYMFSILSKFNKLQREGNNIKMDFSEIYYDNAPIPYGIVKYLNLAVLVF
jgi:hypothetical protein